MARKKEPRKDRKKEAEEKRSEEPGEVFYRAHPIAETRIRVAEVRPASVVIEGLLWWLFVIVETVLLIRIIMAAFGANGGNALTSFFYAISYPFVVPFFYLFNSLGTIQVNSARFELETLAAMLFYYIVIYIITQLIRSFRTTE